MENLLIGLGTLAQSSGGSGGAMLVVVPFLIIGIGTFVFWLWSLIDCIRREFEGSNDKLIWVLVIVLAGALGSLIYVFVGRPRGRLG